MFKNSLKMTLRLFERRRTYAVITVGGLAVAMAVGVLTIAWAQYERSFDRFHRNGRDIYRFITDWRSEKTHYRFDAAPLPLGPVLEKSFPEVRAVVRLTASTVGRVESPTTLDFASRVCLADPSFLSMFDFPLIQGDPRTALIEPAMVVLTESAARKYFGAADPIGQALLFLDKKIPMRVTGIMRDVPKTSHLQFDFLVPLRARDVWFGKTSITNIWEDWTLSSFSSYVQLAPETDPRAFEAKVARIIQERNPKSEYTLSLQPLFRAHLYSGDFSRMGLSSVRPFDIRQVRIFLLIALIVLVVACINYTNLATAHALKRGKEIAVRKVNGAGRRDIARQFLGEAFVFSFIALALAIFLAWSLLPAFRTFSGRGLDLNFIPKIPLILSLLGVAIFTGLLSGLYPAFYVASLAPVRVLREKVRPAKRSLINLRRVLISIQIAGSAVLIVATAVLLLQLRHIRTKDLGYDPKNVIMISFDDNDLVEAIKADLLRHPGILAAADGLFPTMGRQGHRMEGSQIAWEGKPAETNVPMDFIFVDEDYLKTYRASMAQGRFFAKDFPGDQENFVLNESAVKAMGLDDPIDKWFRLGKRRGQIVGVVKDFHLGTLRSKIAPAAFFCAPFANLSIRVDPSQTQAAINHIAATWKKYIKERPFTYRFLEDRIEAMYASDRRDARIVSLFGALSLVLSCLGLFGLIAFLAEQRTKEIGVRKVLGASVGSIVRLMAGEYTVLVGGAVVLAWPISYAVTARWLNGFAYRISLVWWIFAASGALVAAVTLLTLAAKVIQAARLNPVDSLRYE